MKDEIADLPKEADAILNHRQKSSLWGICAKSIADHEHTLDVPMIDVRLHCDHHSLSETPRVITRDHRLLLMPPGADAVTGQHRLVGHARRSEALHHELINLTGHATWSQL